MSVFDSNQDVYKVAVQIVQAALQSQSIKLLGPQYDEEAKADAQYLNNLINSLAANLKG